MQQNDRAEVVLRHRVALFSQCQDADGFGDRKTRPDSRKNKMNVRLFPVFLALPCHLFIARRRIAA